MKVAEKTSTSTLTESIADLLQDISIPHNQQGFCNVAVGKIRRLLDTVNPSGSDAKLIEAVQDALKEVPAIPENGPSACAVGALLKISEIKVAWENIRAKYDKTLLS